MFGCVITKNKISIIKLFMLYIRKREDVMDKFCIKKFNSEVDVHESEGVRLMYCKQSVLELLEEYIDEKQWGLHYRGECVDLKESIAQAKKEIKALKIQINKLLGRTKYEV